MKRRNQDIREGIRKSGIFMWQVAERYGLSDTNFSKLLRKELSEETKTRINRIIEELKCEIAS